MVKWKEEIEWCISRAKGSPGEEKDAQGNTMFVHYIDIDQLTRLKPYTTQELLSNAPKDSVEKLKEVIHTNILNYASNDPKEYARLLAQNLKSKHGYTDRVDMTSKGDKLVININPALLPNELKAKGIESKDEKDA